LLEAPLEEDDCHGALDEGNANKRPSYLSRPRKATGAVRGHGKEFTSIYFGGNAEPFEVIETPEDLLGMDAKLGAI
jgi:hypothetical protein